jgi:ankyrin repeat protein
MSSSVDDQALFTAIQAGDRPGVKKLIGQNPALVQSRDENGISAVLMALYYNHPEIASILVEGGAHLDIFEASAVGNLGRVHQLVDAQPGLANAVAKDGFQPLGLAAFFGHLEVARFLLEMGAEVNSPSDNGLHVMPLHSAAANRHLEIARLLLEHGAMVNARQADDFTPLHAAAQNGQLEMVKLLLYNGADIMAASSGGETPLYFALRSKNADVIHLLQTRLE